jgi:HAD superfamily hydrolase (TIGR01509 family)
MSSTVRAVIFDLDGTLVSSSLDFTVMREELGCPPQEDILHFIDSLQGNEKVQAQALVYRHEMADAQSTKILPGVKELLEALALRDIRTAIVTRNSQQATLKKLEQTSIVVEKVLTRECAPPKPDPAALVQLCRDWDIKPQEAVYTGDYIYDLIAADNAKMHSCLYVSGALPDYAHQADFVCRDYKEFLTQLSRYFADI